MIAVKKSLLIAAVLACGVGAQDPAPDGTPVGAPLRLVAPGALPSRPTERVAVGSVTVERTYQRPKVDPVSHDGEQIAIQGYDVMSYLDRAPRKGRKEYSAEHAGAVWLFATPDNRDAFRRDPEHYLPEYGGYCAFSVSIGSPARPDPRVYAVLDGKLYLFFDSAVRDVWQQDRERSIAEAAARWPGLHR